MKLLIVFYAVAVVLVTAEQAIAPNTNGTNFDPEILETRSFPDPEPIATQLAVNSTGVNLGVPEPDDVIDADADGDKAVSSEFDPLPSTVRANSTSPEDLVLATPSRPLTLRNPDLEKRVRWPKFDDFTKSFRKIASSSESTSALNELDRVNKEAESQIARREKDTLRQLNRMKNETMKQQYREELSSEIAKTRTSILKTIAEQKTELKSMLDNNLNYFVQQGNALVEAAKLNQTSISAKLNPLATKAVATIQSLFAPTSRVMDKIAAQS